MTVGSIRVLSARRAYEFEQDDLRLSMLTTTPLQERLQTTFAFKGIQVAQPMATFGPVPRTLPPGVVCNFGEFVDSDAGIVPIRYLHFESCRVTIDIAGPSSALDRIWAQLSTVIGDERAPDGTPVMGTPTRIRDYSEITFEAQLEAERILDPEVLAIFRNAAGPDSGHGVALVPALWFRVQPSDEIFPGVDASDPQQFQLGFRAGSSPVARRLFSGAPLNSDAHIAFVERLEQWLAGQEPTSA